MRANVVLGAGLMIAMCGCAIRERVHLAPLAPPGVDRHSTEAQVARNVGDSTSPVATEVNPRFPIETPSAIIDELNRRLTLLDALFDYDQASIREDARVALDDNVAVIRRILAEYPRQKLIIEGHCDERGSEEYNLALGDRRAAVVKEFLASMGIPASQLTVASYGKSRPVCTQTSEECWQKNRRAHVTAAP